MKNIVKLIGIIAIVAVIVFATASCSSSDDVEKIIGKARYLTADAAGNVYELVVSYDGPGKYVGQKDDDYRLGIWEKGVETKTSTGTVASVAETADGQKFGLKSGGSTFTVEVSDSWIVGIEGTIPFEGGAQAAPASLVVRGTLANAEDVVYSATFGSADAPKDIDFGFMLNNEGKVDGEITAVMKNAFIKVINGKVSMALGIPDSKFLETLGLPQNSTNITVTPAASGIKVLRQDSPSTNSDGSYYFACVKTATETQLEYCMLLYTDTAFTFSGTAPYSNNGWSGTETWNCSGTNGVKKGWNYYLASSTINNSTKTVNTTYSVPVDSSRPPEGYYWTVISKEKGDMLHPY